MGQMTDNDDRITEVPENREAYENAACAITAPKTIPPEVVEASDPYENDDTYVD
jgi:hypothetical protein